MMRTASACALIEAPGAAADTSASTPPGMAPRQRHLVVEAAIRNYGNPLGSYKGIIREVEIRYWTALA